MLKLEDVSGIKKKWDNCLSGLGGTLTVGTEILIYIIAAVVIPKDDGTIERKYYGQS